jgi:hypothetical protein
MMIQLWTNDREMGDKDDKDEEYTSEYEKSVVEIP